MKSGAIISFFLLSAIVLVLFSTAAQAAEYREINTEVKAEDILRHIENGDDINLTGCRIVGEFNVSTIKLNNIQNPKYDERLNEGHSTDFVYEECTENLSIVESNIKIENSIFENYLDFSSALFKNSVFFLGTNFSDSADFSETNFNGPVYFCWTYFSGPVDFSETNFNSFASFSETNFNSSASFSETNFNSSASFSETNFNGPVDFHWMYVNGSTDFICANFNGSVFFRWTYFNGSANFSGANLNGSVDFFSTNFNGPADFFGTNFSDSAGFIETKFNESADFVGPDTSENIITDGESCELFRKYYMTEARYVDSDNVYYNYRKFSQDNKDLISLSKWSDFLSWIACGYGVRPFRILYSGVFIVGVFTLLYWLGSGIYRSSDTVEKKSKVSFWDSLYFSTSTFTTLGSADWYPTDNFRKWVTLEGLLGWIMLGIFMATLTAVMIRV